MLQRGEPPEPVAVSPQPFAIGWFTYSNGARARILFIEATMTDDVPWDVHAHAESSDVFPDDSTANQLFDHRQFESYRRLGKYQASVGSNSALWTVLACDWQEGRIGTATLRKLIAAANRHTDSATAADTGVEVV